MSQDHKKEFPRGETHSFDPDAFDEAVQSQGVRVVHHSAMRCPVGMIDVNDSRKPHDDHENCSNGFLYVTSGTVRALFTGNSSQARTTEMGILDGSTVQITLPRHYDDSDKQIYAAMYDRFYLADDGDVTVVNWQLFESHATGIDRMRYPIASVEHIVDADGKAYSPDAYEVRNGAIHWKPGKGPGANPKKPGKGMVCTIRYRYRPYWYVKSIVHEVRVTQLTDMLGERKLHRMPYALVLQREYLFENSGQDPNDPTPQNSPESLRQVMAPPSGGFGPR